MLGNCRRLTHHLGELKKPLTKKLFELVALTPLFVGLFACESSKTGLEDPQFGAHPMYTLYEVDGSTRMQSPGPFFNGGNIDMADFGFDDQESGYGGGLSYGDGFAGLRFDYSHIDQSPKGTNTLSANYGLIPEGAIVRSNFEMDEYRLRYTFQVYEHRDEEEDWWAP